MSKEQLENIFVSTDYISVKDEEALKEENKKNKISILEGASIAIEDQLVPSILRLANREELEPDFNFRINNLSDKEFNDLTKDINEENWDAFGTASSLANAYQIKRRLLDFQEKEKKLSTLGKTGIALRVGSALLDLPALALDVVTFGAAKPFIYANKASRISKYIRGGMVGAGQAGLITAPTIAADPTRDMEDLGYAMAFGGAVTGSLTKFLAPKHSVLKKFDSKSIELGKQIERESLEKEGYKLTEKGERYFKKPKYVNLNSNTDEYDDDIKITKKLLFGNQKQYNKEQLDAIQTLKKTFEGDEVVENFFDRIDKTPDVANPFRLRVYDKSFILRRSDNPAMRSTSERVAEDAIGPRDFSSMELTADIHKNNFFKTEITKFYKGYKPALDKFVENKYKSSFSLKRKTIKTYSHSTLSEFSDKVGRAVRGEAIEDPGVQEAALYIRKFLKNFLETMRRDGVKGADEILDNVNYFPRHWSVRKISQIQENIGQENIHNFFKNSLIKGSKNLSEKDALTLSKHIFRMINRSKYGDGISIDRILKSSDETELRDLIKESTDISDGEINSLIKILTKDSKKDVAPRLRRRASFDELHEEIINGTSYRLSDFLDNNAEGIIGAYLHQMSGHVAFARVGIKSIKDFNKIRQRVIDSYDLPEVAKRYKGTWGRARREREIATLDTLYKNIIGIPTETDITRATGIVLRNIRKYNYVNLFNQIGFAQIPEMGNIVGEGGVLTFIKWIPQWKKILIRAKNGKLEDEFLDEMESFYSGSGSNRLIDSVMNRTDDFDGINTKIGKGEKILDVFGRITSDVSGFHLVDTLSRRLATSIAFNKLAKHATGELKLKPKDIKRYKNIGFTDDELEDVFINIRKNSTFIEGGLTGRRIRRLNIDDWDDQDLANKLAVYMSRHTKRITQETNYGEMVGYLRLSDTSWGKTLLQFRNFVLTAYSKQLLHGIHMNDLNFYVAATAGMFFTSLGYIAQTYAQSLGKGDSEKIDFLEERLSPSAIGKAVFQRNTYSTIIPPIFDTLRSAAGFDPVFSYRNTGLESNIITGNPSYQLAEKSWKALTGISKSVLDDEYDFSKRDAKNILRVSPYYNMLGWSNLTQHMIDESDLPYYSE
jgi:hypothetical protein